MKIIKRVSRIYNGKKYFKYEIIIPKEFVEGSGLKLSDKLKVRALSGKLEISKL